MSTVGGTQSQQTQRRRSLRLEGFDYKQAGSYFVTICTYQRKCLLGHVENGEIQLSGYGRLVELCWKALTRHFAEVQLDTFVVMPKHLHCIVVISDDVVARRGEAFANPHGSQNQVQSANASPLHQWRWARGTESGSLGAIIQSFKSVSARKVNQAVGSPGIPVWQRNYYEHVIRCEKELDRVRQYISDNPVNWEKDENNPQRFP